MSFELTALPEDIIRQILACLSNDFHNSILNLFFVSRPIRDLLKKHPFWKETTEALTQARLHISGEFIPWVIPSHTAEQLWKEETLWHTLFSRATILDQNWKEGKICSVVTLFVDASNFSIYCDDKNGFFAGNICTDGTTNFVVGGNSGGIVNWKVDSRNVYNRLYFKNKCFLEYAFCLLVCFPSFFNS
jgi:hypothetical protein